MLAACLSAALHICTSALGASFATVFTCRDHSMWFCTRHHFLKPTASNSPLIVSYLTHEILFHCAFNLSYHFERLFELPDYRKNSKYSTFQLSELFSAQLLKYTSNQSLFKSQFVVDRHSDQQSQQVFHSQSLLIQAIDGLEARLG